MGLAHVRLSIVDLTSGQQPIFDQLNKVSIILNGEIYDHKILRLELEKKGHRFKTDHSDTEVALLMYMEYGKEFIHYLNGEFAFIIWDERIKKMFCYRDRIGVKPLFYSHLQGELFACSEAKGILALPYIKRNFSKDYLVGPMLSVSPKAPSVFQDIKCLKPGHYLSYSPESGILEELPYWKPQYQSDSPINLNDCISKLREHIATSVKRRLVSDAPLCVYLSGGLDSSIVCSEASLHQKIKAFNIGFSNSEFDESSEAREIAKHFGVEFETVSCPMDKLAENLVQTIYHTELHLANPSAIGKFILSDAVSKQGYKVALTGEGSDELFAGYPYFKLEELWRMLVSGDKNQIQLAKNLFKSFKKIEKRSEGILWNRNANWKKAPRDFGFYSFISARAYEYGRKIPQFLQTENFGIGPDDNPFEVLKTNYQHDQLSKLHPLHASLYLSLGQLAAYIIPTLGDRVEMAHAIEGRTPFLDRDLVEFSMTIPPEFLIDIKNLREKNILMMAYQDRLPHFMKKQHKHPFFSPNWHKLSKTAAGLEIFEHYLSKRALNEVGVFRPAFIQRAKLLWKTLPNNSGLKKRLDVLFGVCLSVQILHQMFIAKGPLSNGHFPMADRSV